MEPRRVTRDVSCLGWSVASEPIYWTYNCVGTFWRYTLNCLVPHTLAKLIYG
jgi:hypothetical protein